MLTTSVPDESGTAVCGVPGSLVAMIDIDKDQSSSRIKLVAENLVVLDDTIDLPTTPYAIDGLVCGLTVVVLAAAPYLDLLTTGLRDEPVKEARPLPAAV